MYHSYMLSFAEEQLYILLQLYSATHIFRENDHESDATSFVGSVRILPGNAVYV